MSPWYVTTEGTEVNESGARVIENVCITLGLP
jgi:hypothetical protein